MSSAENPTTRAFEQALSHRIIAQSSLASTLGVLFISSVMSGCEASSAESLSTSDSPRVQSLDKREKTELHWRDLIERESAKTPLGRRLREIRQRIVAEGGRLLDWDEVRAEVRSRRGGIETRSIGEGP